MFPLVGLWLFLYIYYTPFFVYSQLVLYTKFRVYFYAIYTLVIVYKKCYNETIKKAPA